MTDSVIRNITCPVCRGDGRRFHWRGLHCSFCRGLGDLRIEISPDNTGIAPHWARWQAVLADEYDGAATGRAGAVGIGQTADAAIDDLLERIEECE